MHYSLLRVLSQFSWPVSQLTWPPTGFWGLPQLAWPPGLLLVRGDIYLAFSDVSVAN